MRRTHELRVDSTFSMVLHGRILVVHPIARMQNRLGSLEIFPWKGIRPASCVLVSSTESELQGVHRMIDSTTDLTPAASGSWTSKPRNSRPVREATKKRARCSRHREPVLEVLHGRTLLSLVHPMPLDSGTLELQRLTTERSPLNRTLPPPPVFLALPLNQPGGRILSQTHVMLYQRIFLANQTFQAQTGVEYLAHFTEWAKPAGATTSGTAGDTSGAVSTFMQQLVNQVSTHGGSATEFVKPAKANGGGQALASGGVIEGETYLATDNHLTFTMTYATADHFVFNEQFMLKAFRSTLPQTRSSFSLLDAVDEFTRHFEVTG